MLSSRDNLNQITFKKKIVFYIIMFLMIMIFCVIGGELIIRLISPLNFRYPGYSFSKKYGSFVFKNSKIENGLPGKWNCVYSINNYQYRGKLIPLKEKYKKINIVVLGDWYAFGIGVNDGYEFPAVIFKILEKRFNVINLSIPNWGLTQQIRRYFEFGSLYKPDFVILQFCGNNPKDNFKNMVTKIRKGKFVYFNSTNEINKFKKFLSNSVFQKSQLFCLLKKVIYPFFEKRVKKKSIDLYLKKNSSMTKIPPQESFYNELLELFAKSLNKNSVKLIMIATNNQEGEFESQLDQFPYIKKKVKELDFKNLLEYYEVADWLRDVKNYQSKGGQRWGVKAHKIIGENLSKIIIDHNREKL